MGGGVGHVVWRGRRGVVVAVSAVSCAGEVAAGHEPGSGRAARQGEGTSRRRTRRIRGGSSRSARGSTATGRSSGRTRRSCTRRSSSRRTGTGRRSSRSGSTSSWTTPVTPRGVWRCSWTTPRIPTRIRPGRNNSWATGLHEKQLHAGDPGPSGGRHREVHQGRTGRRQGPGHGPEDGQDVREDGHGRDQGRRHQEPGQGHDRHGRQEVHQAVLDHGDRRPPVLGPGPERVDHGDGAPAGPVATHERGHAGPDHGGDALDAAGDGVQPDRRGCAYVLCAGGGRVRPGSQLQSEHRAQQDVRRGASWYGHRTAGPPPLQDGNYHYVVMPGGSVRAFHESIYDSGVWAGHTSLSGGKPVVMAGTFDVSNGSVARFDNFSGHYRPGGSGMESVARDALNRNGFNAGGARWEPFRFD